MNHELQKYLISEQFVEVIYLDRHGNTSKRMIRLLKIRNGLLKAYCLTKRAPRIFVIDNILAVQPVVSRHAV